MIRLFAWLSGYVNFRFSNGFVEGFINDCYNEEICITSICSNDNAIDARCATRDYIKLHRIALNNGGRLKIIKKNGVIFPLLKLKNRWGLLSGVLCFVAIVTYLSGFVWNVEIVGNSIIQNSDIYHFLEENGLKSGVYAKNVDKDVVENLLMYSFEDCAWAHINIDGTTAIVEIDETISKPNLVDAKRITNVKAKKDGIILDATTYDGWQIVQNGDAVAKGDLLISGIYEGENGKRNLFSHARGKIMAEVNEKIDIVISRQQCKKRYVSFNDKKSLVFFGLNIPLSLPSNNNTNIDIETDNNYLVLNNQSLPIGIVTKTEKQFAVDVVVLSDKELNALIKDEIAKKIERDFCSYEILEQNIEITLNSQEARAEGTVVCIEDIGREVDMKIKE